MSIKVMNLIWQNAPYRGNTLLTLLALGDWADDDGVSWPKIETLAAKSRQSERSTRYALEDLAKDGVLAVDVNPGRGNKNEYRINLQKLHLLGELKRCKTRPEKVQFTTLKGAKRDSAIRKNRQEPSENRQIPPNPPAGGLTPRQLKNLSDEMDSIAASKVGVHPFPTDRDLLVIACQRLMIPFEAAYAALVQTLPPEQRPVMH